MTQWLRIGMVLLAGSAACGDNLAAEVGSGTRLKISWIVFGDGTRMPTGAVHDAAREEACAPLRWADGVVRCTPPVGPFLLYEPIFTGPTCTESVMYMGEDYVPPPYAADYAEPPGHGLERLRHLDTVALAEVWLRDDAGACVGPYDGTGHRFFRRGDEIPRGELVEMVDDVVASDGRFSLLAHESYDGLYLPFGFRDDELGHDCTLAEVAADHSACLPPDPAAIRYRDDTCQVPAQAVWSEPPPAYVGDAGYCEPQVWKVGGPLDEPPRFDRDVAGTCAAGDPVDDVRWFSLAAQPVATVERRRVASPGHRLEAFVLSSGGHELPDGTFFDTLTGEPCAPGVEGDVVRCLPIQVGYIHPYYRDAGCTQVLPLANVFPVPPVAPCSVVGTPPHFAIDFGVPGQYVALAQRFTERVWRVDDVGACVDTPYAGLRWAPELYTLGATVDAGYFVEATVVTDP